MHREFFPEAIGSVFPLKIDNIRCNINLEYGQLLDGIGEGYNTKSY